LALHLVVTLVGSVPYDVVGNGLIWVFSKFLKLQINQCIVEKINLAFIGTGN
jgi:hypothetical protein